MVQKKIGVLLVICGMLSMLVGASTLPAPEIASAMPPLQPSPRPTLAPTAKSGDSDTPATEYGHITGTVIDTRTGAPAQGVSVNIGGVIVVSDENGNYDRWVPVGTYTVTLTLPPALGTPGQDTQMVQVNAGSATVQHLNFASQGAAPAVAEQQAAVVQPTASQPVAADTPAGGTPPTRLPRTAGEPNNAWLWLAVGLALVIVGGAMGIGPAASQFQALRPTYAAAANDRMTGATTKRRAALAGFDPNVLLADLLARDTRKPASRPAKQHAAQPEQDRLLATLLESGTVK
jgi:hypothetical protein